MRGQAQMMDPGMLQMQQQVDLMKSMGLMQDPLQQASGLVNLLNASEAPGIQQEQFGREMGLRELMQQAESQRQERALQQQMQHQQWQQSAGDRTFGLQQQELGLNERKLGQDQTQFDERMQFENFSRLLSMYGLGFGAATDPRGSGMLDVGRLNQFGGQLAPGLGGLLNPQPMQQGGPGPEWGQYDNADIPSDKLYEATSKYR